MPVLDAKALETDPKGMAFLLSVLRQKSTPEAPAKRRSRAGRLHFRIVRRLRVLRPGIA